MSDRPIQSRQIMHTDHQVTQVFAGGMFVGTEVTYMSIVGIIYFITFYWGFFVTSCRHRCHGA